jgi:hypothetical protein
MKRREFIAGLGGAAIVIGGKRRLAPNPTSRRDHSDLPTLSFSQSNEIRIELIAERAASP